MSGMELLFALLTLASIAVLQSRGECQANPVQLGRRDERNGQSQKCNFEFILDKADTLARGSDTATDRYEND